MISSTSPACVTSIRRTHDRPVTNHPHSCPSLSLSVVFFAVDRSVPSAEVVKALRSLVNSVPGHFKPLKKTEVTKDQANLPTGQIFRIGTVRCDEGL